MTQIAYILFALAIGLGSAFQVGMLGSISRERGTFEATWLNVLPSLIGISAVFIARSLVDNPTNLPWPLSTPWPFIALLAVSVGALAFSMQGLPAYLALTGIFGFAYVMAASFLAPKLGIALYYSATSSATLAGGVALDHLGTFGDAHHVTVIRGVGLTFLLLGIVLVRSSR